MGPCRGFGFITMATVDAAAAAIKCASPRSFPHSFTPMD